MQDVVVLGAGPAGLAVATACAEHGLSVTCLAPEPQQRWQPTYGCWEEEARGLDLADAVQKRFARPRVWLSAEDQPRDLGGTYQRFDTARLQQLLSQRLDRSGARLEAGRATQIEPHQTGSIVRLTDGSARRATVVVDASGAASPFVRRWGKRLPAFQAAYGELLEVDGHPYADGEMALMDWRGPSRDRVPSFLYALPMSRRRVFVEETVLVGRPAMPFASLRARLYERLGDLGIRPERVVSREHCLIPMGLALTRLSQRTVAFGAAAAAVHPATGYQLARTLGMAPAVGEAIAASLSRGPADAARAAYEVIWPRWRLRAWELYRVGMESLVRFDRQQTQRFFSAFFELPEDRWRGFMHGSLTPVELAGAMWQVFNRAPASLRVKLISTSAGRGSRSLMRAIAPWGAT